MSSQTHNRLRQMLSRKKHVSTRAEWTFHGDFPSSSVQPSPFVYDYHGTNQKKDVLVAGYMRTFILCLLGSHHPDIVNQTSLHELPSIVELIGKYFTAKLTFVYTTRYEADNQDRTGVILYSAEQGHTPLIKWCDTQYFPRWMATEYDAKRDRVIFAGGSNVKRGNAEYSLLAFYDLRSKHMEFMELGHVIGSNAKMLFLDNDNKLHIIGGQFNDKHLVFDMQTKRCSVMHDFGGTNPQIQEQGLVHNPVTNTLMMFGGYHLQKYRYYDDFWELDLNHPVATVSMSECARLLVDGYVKRTFLPIANDKYDRALNGTIAGFVDSMNIYPQWKRREEFQMLDGIRSFGTVFYRSRVVVVLGGIVKHQLIDTIYYLDIEGKNGWRKSKMKMPSRGMCSAVLVEDTVHVFPYYAYKGHFTLRIKHILPDSLWLF